MNGQPDSCAAYRDALMDVLDGTAPPAARDHGRTCAACAELSRAFGAQAALLSRARRPLPPPDLGLRIEAALGSRGVRTRRPSWRAWAAAAAAAVIVAFSLRASPAPAAPERTVRVVDVELPDRGSYLGRLSPNAENPMASLLDPLDSGENP
jgi:predicted anti-sigma-YlaC factor YlaD